jgi:hypothetical protein
LFSRQRLGVILVLLASTTFYVYGLNRAPVYMGGDEAHQILA